MEDKTKKFVRKIRFDTFIYCLVFLLMSVSYLLFYDIRTEPLMLLLAAFAFYTLGRQVKLIESLEGGAVVDTRPRAPLWIRLFAYGLMVFVIIYVLFF